MQIEFISSGCTGFRDPLRKKVPMTPTLALGLDTNHDIIDGPDSQLDGVVTVNGEEGVIMLVIFASARHSLVKVISGTGEPQLVQLTGKELDLLGDGDVTVTARTADDAGNIGRPSDELIFWLDTLPADGVALN